MTHRRTRSKSCRVRGCRHSPTDHLETPELIGRPGEVVFWCLLCFHHEVQRPPMFQALRRRLSGERLFRAPAS